MLLDALLPTIRICNKERLCALILALKQCQLLQNHSLHRCIKAYPINHCHLGNSYLMIVLRIHNFDHSYRIGFNKVFLANQETLKFILMIKPQLESKYLRGLRHLQQPPISKQRDTTINMFQTCKLRIEGQRLDHSLRFISHNQCTLLYLSLPNLLHHHHLLRHIMHCAIRSLLYFKGKVSDAFIVISSV